MNDKKNIEQIFQNKLKNYEEIPPLESWDYIAEKLHEKKKKNRIIPLFWTYSATLISSAAALLIIGFFLFKDYEKNPKTNQSTSITHSKKINQTKTSETSSKTLTNNSNAFADNSYKSNLNKNTYPNSLVEKSKDKISIKNNLEKNSTPIPSKIIEDSKTTDQIITKNLEKLADNTNNKTPENPFNIDKSASSMDKNEEKELNILSKNETKTTEALDKKIAKEVKKAKKDNKFSVSGFAAPIYAFSGGGSAIDSKLNSNNNAFNKNMSVGINTDYALSEKIKIRSGIHFINLNNETQNVSFFKTSVSTLENLKPFKNLNSNRNLSEILIVNNLQNTKDLAAIFGTSNLKSGEIHQELSFVEIPLEVSFPIYSKKLKISTVSGFSTYFLDKNRVFLISGNESIDIGKANNINSIHYSGNLGLNFMYGIKDKYNIVLEPIFKYQINTYESGSTDSKPYFIGIYTGFSYNF